ncbi:OTU domain-containing protein 6B [Apostichopus japonicus]|uniref:ubiquitinyl hydrolase 1 n=1 Tax=Stichopus japonicus TaxID=307972 RepID=A0A2G8K6T4_STIJA|nr:OTU domain-containing protein 6B [Apostichopus japonicus]
MEELDERHRKERKELQAKIQAIKKAVTKGDRKRKKESNEEISRLEAELKKRHEEEKQNMNMTDTVEEEVSNEMERVSVNGQQEEVKLEPKVSKAQRRREKKAASEKERDHRIAEEESKNVNSNRRVEYEKIKTILKQRGLAIKEIPSDGHCLYRAVADQLLRQETETTVERLRKQTADYMRNHSDDFMAFLTNPETQDLLTSEEYEKYCLDVETTASWGGQLEINAMSNFLQVPVEVIQADGPPIMTGEDRTSPTIILSYHRHAYGLGEHYNSVTTTSQVDQSESADDEGFS